MLMHDHDLGTLRHPHRGDRVRTKELVCIVLCKTTIKYHLQSRH